MLRKKRDYYERQASARRGGRPLSFDRADRTRTLVTLLLLFIDVLALLAAQGLTGSWGSGGFVYSGIAFGTLVATGAYRLRLNLRVLDEASIFMYRMAVPLFLILVTRSLVGFQSKVMQAAVAFITVLIGRVCAYALIRRGRQAGFLSERTLIVGGGALGRQLLGVLEEHKGYGLVPVGYVDNGARTAEAMCLGGVGETLTVLEQYEIKRIIVADPVVNKPDLVALIRAAVLRGCKVHVVPRLFELGVAPRGLEVDELWGIPVYGVRRAAIHRRAWIAKRLIDITGAALCLVVVSPVIIAIALVVRLSSPGPILFRQPRIGQNCHPIEVLKFRTLVGQPIVPMSETLADLASYDAETLVRSQLRNEVARRQTTAGRYLRELSLDELPQLWNVLRGDMSLVGPRPAQPHEAAAYDRSIDGYGDRHRVPVGLTGWAQIHGLRGDTSIVDRVRFDNYYIEHWSLWRDIVVLGRTVGAVLRQAFSGLGLERSQQEPAVVDLRPTEYVARREVGRDA